MAVLRESPWYQEILQEGRQQGRQEGEQRGREEGERSLILKQLIRRVGELPPDTIAQIDTLSIDQLEGLGAALLDFTQTNDLVNWLEQNS